MRRRSNVSTTTLSAPSECRSLPNSSSSSSASCQAQAAVETENGAWERGPDCTKTILALELELSQVVLLLLLLLLLQLLLVVSSGWIFAVPQRCLAGELDDTTGSIPISPLSLSLYYYSAPFPRPERTERLTWTAKVS